MGRVTVGEICLMLLLIYNPSKNFNEPEQIYSDSNEGTIGMVEEIGRHFSEMASSADWRYQL